MHSLLDLILIYISNIKGETDMSILKEIRNIHNVLYVLSNQSEEELIPIILCILHKYRQQLISVCNEKDAMLMAINQLKEGVKEEMIATLEDIKINHDSLSPLLEKTLVSSFTNILNIPAAKYESIIDYIAGNHRLLEGLKENDFIGMLYETMVSEAFSGKNGQFFTPKTIILAMREILAITIKKMGEKSLSNISVCDPCCGSARFLVYWGALLNEEISKNMSPAEISQAIKDIYRKCLFGIDVEQKIASYACINMLLHGDGSTNIENADSLNYYGVFVYWPLLKEFSKEFSEKWDSTVSKYSINIEYEEKARFIEENKAVVVEIQHYNTSIDIADKKWVTFFKVLDYLFELDKKVGTNIKTLEKIRRLSEEKPLFQIIKHNWAEKNSSIITGLDAIITNPPFGRGKNLKINFSNPSGELILPQYKLATMLWIFRATKEQLQKVIDKYGLNIKTDNKKVSEIAEEVRQAINKEWLTIDDVEDVTSYLDINDSTTGYTHRIYYDKNNKPMVFKRSLPKQILFLEQFLRMVKDGGLVFTVIDTGILSNSDDEYVRNFLFKHAKIHAIVEFPHNAFKAARTGVKTAIILMEKISHDIENNYEIFGALPNHLGYVLNKQDTPPKKENDLGMVLCDYYKYLGYNRLCSAAHDSEELTEENCTWIKEGFCIYWKEKIEKLHDDDYLLDEEETDNEEESEENMDEE